MGTLPMRATSTLTALSCLSLLPTADLRAQSAASNRGKAYTRRQAELGELPKPAGVVVRDMINYHRHRIPLPKVGEELAVDLRWDAPLPAERDESILQIGLATPQLDDLKDLPVFDVALVVDRSSSMASDDKIGRLEQALTTFVGRLRPSDRLAIIAYSDVAEVCLPSQPVGDGRRVREAIRGLQPGGHSNLHAGLMRGYEELDKHREEKGNRRVVLLTDGRADRGVTDRGAIARESRAFNDRGIDLSTIGFGEDINHDLLADLARAGRGLFHFVADTQDIDKVFVTEAQSLMGVVGRDCRVAIEPAPGLSIERIYGYAPSRTEAGVEVEHENFHFGMTAVLVVRIRHAGGDQATGSPRLPVRVRVSYRSARDDRRVEMRASSDFLHPRRAQGATDPVVRKNFAIALMADAMHEMARHAQARHYADADRALARALRFARDNYPKTEDPDLVQTRNTVEKYRAVLSRHIERFRDQ